MDGHEPETIDGQTLAETPEDVAVLYSWANLQGAKYRDFSASRREYRAQMRHRAAQAQRDAEERAKEEAERAAAEAERAAREAEEAARFHGSAARDASDSRSRQEVEMEEAAQARAMRHAAELSRRAAAERVEAARRAEAVAAAEAAARREAREMAEARASAQRQAQRYEASEVRRRSLAGPQPSPMLPGEITDPYTDDHIQQLPGRIFHQPNLQEEDDMLPQRHPQTRDVRLIVPQPDPMHPHADEGREYLGTGSIEDDARIAAGGAVALHRAADKPGSPISYYYEPDSVEKTAAVDSYAQFSQYVQSTTPPPSPAGTSYDPVAEAETNRGRRPRGYQPDEASGFHQPFQGNLGASESSVPAWISAPPEKPRGSDPLRRASASPVEDTLQHSRERVAARWFALKGVFDHGVQEQAPEVNAARAKEMRVPLLTIFSMAGGVGKTSLVATLGRALSSAGEKVLLTDTTSHGLLPFYFGASELRPGVVRTFSPPVGSADAPIYLVSYDVLQKGNDPAQQEWLLDELTRNSRGLQRVILDLAPSASWLARRMAQLNSVIVVPVAPDMNSVISLGPMEKFFAGILDGDGRPVQPHYLLNQFDASLPLHLDVREVMRRQLGDRLLPFVIRRSQSVSEALAEGMTVMDYAPEASVAADYMNLASWLRSLSLPATTAFKNARWSER
jgi:cellulose synthase operon protein YhjQ